MRGPADVVRRTRWRGRYLWKQTRRRARSWFVTVPVGRSPRRSLWLCSWQRSGSTWLAEMLSTAATTRLVYEPANVHQALFDGASAAHVPLPRDNDPSLTDVVRALRGELRGVWIDQINTALLVRRRVVKDVRATALAGAVRAAVPESPVVILLRHPLAVARSVVDLGWTTGDPLAAVDHEVERWCDEHATLFGDRRLADAYFVAYERLREQPVATVRAIFEYAGTFDPTWLRTIPDDLDPAKRSATDFRSTSAAADATWGDLDPESVQRAGAILRSRGLVDLYNESPHCQCDPNDFAAMFRVRESI